MEFKRENDNAVETITGQVNVTIEAFLKFPETVIEIESWELHFS